MAKTTVATQPIQSATFRLPHEFQGSLRPSARADRPSTDPHLTPFPRLPRTQFAEGPKLSRPPRKNFQGPLRRRRCSPSLTGRSSFIPPLLLRQFSSRGLPVCDPDGPGQVFCPTFKIDLAVTVSFYPFDFKLSSALPPTPTLAIEPGSEPRHAQPQPSPRMTEKRSSPTVVP